MFGGSRTKILLYRGGSPGGCLSRCTTTTTLNNIIKPVSTTTAIKTPATLFSSLINPERQHLNQISFSTSLQSTTITLPAFCTTASRLCSSSASSHNNNNNNANEIIDVTSFRSRAKQVLQEAYLDSLVFSNKREHTVSQVVGAAALEEFLAQFNIDTTLSKTIKASSAIKLFDRDFTLLLELNKLKEEQLSGFLDAINQHENMRNFIKDRNLMAKLKKLEIRSVYDWYSKRELHHLFDENQRARINSCCIVELQLGIEENERQKKIERFTGLYSKHIKLSSLTPGQSHRHSESFGYGVLTRDEEFERLSEAAHRLGHGTTKEDLHLIAIRSLDGQGKTRLTDELGYRKGFYGKLDRGKADETNTFIFNVTFGTKWPVKVGDPSAVRTAGMKRRAKSVIRGYMHRRRIEEDLGFSLDEKIEVFIDTYRELCRRVVAAAVGIYTLADYQKNSDLKAICEGFIDAHNCDFDAVWKALQKLLASKRHFALGKSSDSFIDLGRCILILDEVSHLMQDKCHGDKFDGFCYGTDGMLEERFYENLARLVASSGVAVVVSGCRLQTVGVAVFGIYTDTVRLSPISSAYLRRELHAMKSKYFQLCAKQPSGILHKDAIYYFELVKSAPGWLGTLIENLQKRSDESRNDAITIGILGAIIPRIESLGEKERMSMLEILQLKSVLHGDAYFVREPHLLNRFVNKILERAARNKVTDSNSRGRVEELRSARLEPLCVEAMKGKWPNNNTPSHTLVLDEYWSRLSVFSAIKSRIDSDGYVVNQRDCTSVFNRFRTQASNDDTTATRIEKFMVQRQKKEKENRFLHQEHLRNLFFEDAIVAGILAQRHLRRQAMLSFNKLKEILPNPASALDKYLFGSAVVCSIDQYKRINDCFPNEGIFWNSLSPSFSSSPSSISLTNSIIEFDGHFPCAHKNKKHDKNDVSSEHCDSLDRVLVPRRLQCNKDRTIQRENNPLVDVIFNERFEDGSLAQFWIDCKKHHPHPTSRKHGSSILNHQDLRRGLQEIARRIKEDGSQIRHIVHIIVSPIQLTTELRETTAKCLKRRNKKKASLPSPLKSYTLCLVSPDDVSGRGAFENLISQPIALTVPLIEQQMTESWTRQVPSPSQWWNYNATNGSCCSNLVKHRLEKRCKLEGDELHKWCDVISSMTGEFDQWRQIQFNGDCAIGIGHLFETEEEAKKNLLFEGSINDQPHRSLEIPFGCILEALGILPPRTHGTSYCQCDTEDFRFKLHLVDNSGASDSLTVRFEISVIDKKIDETLEEQQKPPLGSVTMNSKWLLDQIRVGHLLRFDRNVGNRKIDYEECDALSYFWNKQVKEYRKEDELIGKQINKKSVVTTCSDLWNMSLGEFSELLLKEDTNQQHNRFCEICTALLDAEKNTGFGKGKDCSNAIVGELALFLKDEITKYSFF